MFLGTLCFKACFEASRMKKSLKGSNFISQIQGVHLAEHPYERLYVSRQFFCQENENKDLADLGKSMFAHLKHKAVVLAENNVWTAGLMPFYISLSTSVTQKEIGTILKKTSIDLPINIFPVSRWRATDINCSSARHKNKEQINAAWKGFGNERFGV